MNKKGLLNLKFQGLKSSVKFKFLKCISKGYCLNGKQICDIIKTFINQVCLVDSWVSRL